MCELIKIQQGIKTPKTNENKFGKFKYRKKTDIFEAVKPFLAETQTYIIINDDIFEVGGRLFLKATANLHKKDGSILASAWSAAELDKHAGMSAEQATGAASSYAGKYALQNLLGLDDSELDPDTFEQPQKLAQALSEIDKAVSVEELLTIFKNYNELQKVQQFSEALTKKKQQLNK